MDMIMGTPKPMLTLMTPIIMTTTMKATCTGHIAGMGMRHHLLM
jgi:hypothetical protein